MAKKKNTSRPRDDIAILDDLIKLCGQGLRERIAEDGKVGDLIKMIELKRKLAPADSDQRKFWRMIDDIRRENLPEKEKTRAKDTTRPSREGKKR